MLVLPQFLIHDAMVILLPVPVLVPSALLLYSSNLVVKWFIESKHPR